MAKRWSCCNRQASIIQKWLFHAKYQFVDGPFSWVEWPLVFYTHVNFTENMFSISFKKSLENNIDYNGSTNIITASRLLHAKQGALAQSMYRHFGLRNTDENCVSFVKRWHEDSSILFGKWRSIFAPRVLLIPIPISQSLKGIESHTKNIQRVLFILPL